MKKTILVTGGAGYIGLHVIQELVRSGYQVIALDSMVRGNASRMREANLFVCDVTNSHLLNRIVARHDIDAIVHLAGYKDVGESMRHPGHYFHNNVTGTLALLESALESRVEHMVFSSSCSVYGSPQVVPVDERQPYAPESVYAETKVQAERLLAWYDRTHGLKSVSLRYFNAAGASFDSSIGEDWSVSRNLIPTALRCTIKQDAEFGVYGKDYPTPDGTCIRDYTHVVDIARAHVAALDYLFAGGSTVSLNVGTGMGNSVLEVLQTINEVVGREVPFVFEQRREGDPAIVFSDASQAKAVLNWEARHNLHEMISTAYQWHINQP